MSKLQNRLYQRVPLQNVNCLQFRIMSEKAFSTGCLMNLDINPAFFFGNFRSYSSGFSVILDISVVSSVIIDLIPVFSCDFIHISSFLIILDKLVVFSVILNLKPVVFSVMTHFVVATGGLPWVVSTGST